MKTAFMIFAAIFFASPAFASDAQDIQRCVGTLMNDPRVSREKAEYACANPWLEYRETDSKEQNAIREELARSAAEAHEDIMRGYEDNLEVPALTPERL